MNAETAAAIEIVKTQKAIVRFDEIVKVYGTISNALKSLDCKTKEEAVKMISTVQTYRIYKVNGRTVVE